MTGTSPLSELDQQLMFSAILPDFEAWLKRMAADSAAVSLPLTKVIYGSGPRQWIEIGGGSGPRDTTVVFFHGGYWRALDAETHRFVLPGLSGLGRFVANAEYRLLPNVRMADVVADAADAALTAFAETGAKRLILAGHSAGAHLAISALRDAEIRAATAGLVLVSGVYDLAPVRQSFLQAELALTEAEAAEFSFSKVPGNVPSLLLTGKEETAIFRQQARALAATTPSAQLACITGTHHMNVLFALANPKAPVARAVAHWRRTGTFPDRIEGSFT